MAQKISKYPIADDYYIECITKEVYGEKTYDVNVIFDTLGIEIESKKGMKNPNEANECFKNMKQKYKGL